MRYINTHTHTHIFFISVLNSPEKLLEICYNGTHVTCQQINHSKPAILPLNPLGSTPTQMYDTIKSLFWSWCYGEAWMYNQYTQAQANDRWQFVPYVTSTWDVLQMQGSFLAENRFLTLLIFDFFSLFMSPSNSNTHSLEAAKCKEEDK